MSFKSKRRLRRFVSKAKISNKGILFVVSAPSGAGKTTIVTLAMAQDRRLKRTVSHTTRSPRPGERNGRDYFFVDRPTFSRLKAQGGFLETAVVYGENYGTSKQVVEKGLSAGKDMILVIEGKGARQIKRRHPDAVFVLLLPPSLDELRRRIRGRGDSSPHSLALREASAQKEVQGMTWYDYLIVNDRKAQAVRDLLAVIQGERLKLARQRAIMSKFLIPVGQGRS